MVYSFILLTRLMNPEQVMIMYQGQVVVFFCSD